LERKVRDSCGKSVAKGDPAGHAEEAPGPPAESECLEWKSTIRFTTLKNVRVDFRIPLPFRQLSAKPHQSKRLWGHG